MKKMLKSIVLVLIGCCFINTDSFAQIKERTIFYAKCAYYEGPADKKSPQGQGKMVINDGDVTKITITGTFEDTKIADAVVNFTAPGVTFKGKVYYEKKREMLLLLPVPVIILQLSDGGFYQNGQLLGNIGDQPVTLNIDCSLGVGTFNTISGELRGINSSYDKIIETAKVFADCTDYSLENGTIIPFKLSSGKFTMEPPKQSADSVTLLFANGSKVVLSDPKKGEGTWTRANGDYMTIDKDGNLSDYRLTMGATILTDSLVTYKFDNGNQYVGSVCEGFVPDNFKELINLKTLDWPWSKFCDYAKNGTLTYADGSGYCGKFSGKGFNGSDKLDNSAYADGELFDGNGAKIVMIEGVTKEEYAKLEAERKARYEKEKAADYYKFDEQGDIKEFVLTYPDLAKHRYLRSGDKVIRNVITYADGTVMEMSWQIDNDSYKELRAMQAAPDYVYSNTIGKRIFTDGLTVTIRRGYISRAGAFHADLNGNWIIEEPKKDNGDYAVLVGIYQFDSQISEQIDVESMKKTFPDYTVFYDKDQRVEYPNGNVYRGRYSLQTEGKSPLLNDARIRAFHVDVVSSYDNVVGIKFTDGVVCDSNGKIIEIYKNGNKLDDFDFERERIQMQNKLEEERKRIEAENAQKAANEKLMKEFIQKHGEKNVMAAASGEIKVGMHIDLLKIAVYAKGWKMNLERDGGNKQLYRIHGMTLNDYGSSAAIQDGTIAYVSVSGNKVTNINWYGTVRTY